MAGNCKPRRSHKKWAQPINHFWKPRPVHERGGGLGFLACLWALRGYHEPSRYVISGLVIMYVKNLVSLLLFNCLCISAAFGQAIGISGVADRSAYNNQVSFLITNSAGFTYSATLDGNSVPVGSRVLINKIDYHELFVWRTNTSTLATSNRLVRFVITTAGRDCCEWGLPPWTP